MPAAHAASIKADASSRLSPWPKSSGADPIPPKFPQPSAILDTSSPVVPSGRRSTGRAYGSYAAEVEPGAEDYSQPILSGEGASDYERYLRTDELLALQKTAEEQTHRDELLFQTVHQASELWLKLAWSEAEEASRLIEQGELQGAQRLLRRSLLAMDYVIAQLEMLEALSPWEYQAIRKVLGHGSGFDSPGFRQIRRVTPPLGQAFHEKLRDAGLNVVSLYVQGREHEDLYQLAELLLSWDERVGLWRMRHYLVVARVIGDQVVGTQGTPVELLGGLIKQRFYPELWQARNRLTELANQEP
jgi:tryptophan 2,3-dioxygenase